jgi:glycosyltransferase involved in cell wall biosynthesis
MSAPTLRIAVWHNLPSGGGKRALWNHVRGLIQRGHHVEAFCPESAAGGYLPLADLCAEHALPLAASKKPWAPRLWRWWAEAKLAQGDIAAHRAHAQLAAARIAQGGFDVLFANSCATFAAPAIGRYAAMPRVLYLGEPRRQLYEALPDLPWPAPKPAAGAATCSLGALRQSGLALGALRLRMREERDNASHAGTILVNSAFARESVLRAYGLDAEVCMLGIDTDRFRPTGCAVGSFVMGLGAVQPHKGVDRAILALAAVPERRRPALVWVSNDEGAGYRAEVEALAQRHRVAFSIRSRTSDAELVALLSEAAALLYTPRLEPFGLAPLEANACGTPVIAIAEGGVRESLVDGENGILVPDARPDAIAKALLRLLDEPGLAAQLRRRCRDAVVARYSLDAALDRLEGALRRAITERGPAGNGQT